MSDPDQYELYLTGRLSAGRLCDSVGLDKVEVHEVLVGLQNAHDTIVKREAVELLVGIVRGLGDGKVTPALVKEMFEAGPEAVGELGKWLETAKPSFDHLFTSVNWNRCPAVEWRNEKWWFKGSDIELSAFLGCLDGGISAHEFCSVKGLPDELPAEVLGFLLRSCETAPVFIPWSSSDIHRRIREAGVDEP